MKTLDPATRLRANPAFVMASTFDGRSYVARDAEPYDQYWLDERERLLLAFFARRGGLAVAEAKAAWLRTRTAAASPAEERRIDQAITGLHATGVLLDEGADSSRYDRRIAVAYRRHRPFPPELAAHIVQAGGVGRETRVLDLAGGPGDLALELARRSQRVTLMELSRGFIAEARSRARAAGLALQTAHDSCNRLAQRDDEQDVITVSQALHWLDDVAVCRGVCRLLAPDGSFFVVHGAVELPDAHPLAYLFGWDSILGAKQRQSFAAELRPLQRRLALLFEALDAPEVQRIDPTQGRDPAKARIGTAGVALFRQPRPFGPGYARGFLTPRHIAPTGMSEDAFWADLDARCAGKLPAEMMGTQHWAVLHFRRGASVEWPTLAEGPVAEIGYEEPAAA